MTKQEILEEFQQLYKAEFRWIKEQSSQLSANDWLSSALDRYGYSLAEASVPREARVDPDVLDFEYTDGYNDCRLATLRKAREITNSEEK